MIACLRCWSGLNKIPGETHQAYPVMTKEKRLQVGPWESTATSADRSSLWWTHHFSVMWVGLLALQGPVSASLFAQQR